MVEVMYHLYLFTPLFSFPVTYVIIPSSLLISLWFSLPPPPANILEEKCCHLHYFFFFIFINITLLPSCEFIMAAVWKTVQSLSDAFGELQNWLLFLSCLSLSICLSVCMSICMKQLGSHWMGFHEILYLSIAFWKSIKKIQEWVNSSFIKIWQE